MMIQMSILINFKVISHSWPKREETNIVTADNYIIFNNLIIGQTANDHSAEVNIPSLRIELQFIMMGLIMHHVCALHAQAFRELEGGERRTRRRKLWNGCFLCLLPSFSYRKWNQCYWALLALGVSRGQSEQKWKKQKTQNASYIISTEACNDQQFTTYVNHCVKQV